MRGHQTSHCARIIHIGSYQEPDARTFSGRTHGGPTGLLTRASGNLLEVSVAASGRWPDIWGSAHGLEGRRHCAGGCGPCQKAIGAVTRVVRPPLDDRHR